MESEIVSVGEILGRLAQRYGFRTDVALAEHLGVTRQTVGNWRSRGSLDHALLIRAFPDADLNWLFRGAETPKASPEASEGVQKAVDFLLSQGYRVTLEGPRPGSNS